MSNRNGYAVLGRLDVIANRPLLDVSAVLPAPRLSVDAGGGMTVSGAVDPQDYPGATVIRKGPVALRVEQTLSNGSTPSRPPFRSEEHTSEPQSLMRIPYAVFCLKKKTNRNHDS